MIPIKLLLSRLLTSVGTDRLFRHLNRKKLVSIMYHGVTRASYAPPLWTQLPADKFEEQILFLKKNYNIVSVSELTKRITAGQELPERSACITFDDGLRNNYSVAYPILARHSVPATIYLTTDFIDSERILWFDELFFSIKKMQSEGLQHELHRILDEKSLSGIDDTWEVYVAAVNKMKRITEVRRQETLRKLRNKSELDITPLLDDFGILSRNQILEMHDSGLIEFGVHTANHRILTNLTKDEWEREIKLPYGKLSELLGIELLSFCYPNGFPGLDFGDEHMRYVEECQYTCAFSTESTLYEPVNGERFKIGRIPAGNDISSESSVFRLATSGFKW